MLKLRLGFASYLVKGETAFLVLGDGYREVLVA